MILTAAQMQRYRRRLAELDVLIDARTALVPVNIQSFKMAAILGDAQGAELAREEVLRIQGDIMDHIYARTALMREAGLI